jgi:hypothetical protein
MLHFLDGFFALFLGEPLIAPVFAHLVVDEILVDGRELRREDFIQGINDFGIASHGAPNLPQPRRDRHGLSPNKYQ